MQLQKNVTRTGLSWGDVTRAVQDLRLGKELARLSRGEGVRDCDALPRVPFLKLE
jgi:hypothetical protein